MTPEKLEQGAQAFCQAICMPMLPAPVEAGAHLLEYCIIAVAFYAVGLLADRSAVEARQ